MGFLFLSTGGWALQGKHSCLAAESPGDRSKVCETGGGGGVIGFWEGSQHCQCIGLCMPGDSSFLWCVWGWNSPTYFAVKQDLMCLAPTQRHLHDSHTPKVGWGKGMGLPSSAHPQGKPGTQLSEEARRTSPRCISV